MIPTSKLRFVEREIRSTKPDGDIYIVKKIIVLQQWCAPVDATENEIRLELNGEWRDVRQEKEQ